MYRIKTFGYRSQLSQIDRIERGFKLLGHEIVEDGPDFIFCNDKHSHKEAVQYKVKNPKAKLILNVLDLPVHVKDYKQIIDDLSINFYFADAVTTISNTVKEQMLSLFPYTQKFGIDVIYQPIKSVKPLNLKRNENLAVFGRQNDSNKNFLLALRSSILCSRVLHVIGPENPTENIQKEFKRFCEYRGLVDDKQLNVEYNSCNAVLICSSVEGLCLPLIESIVTKTPVVCVSSMSTAKEFCPPEFICEPSPFNISDKLSFILNNKDKVNLILDEFSEKYTKQFSKESVAFNIIKCYEKIK